ncbi:ATP-binding cassette domain-containing protein [Duganella sp. FT92W]|uniref:ATP-binding cassette domain-containing protein n=1 Tax=Pseudoduganella rivuli TaxID=2666085 RepID=A0A7X2IS84_9BURK|nr:branched-chain amino acid ABC transporter ATP-binding protein/permease [Pseudoduganella rivuli]MRV75020.1 ATP-binding cassette domain-containing protein [Pseudoduganella rivuli]
MHHPSALHTAPAPKATATPAPAAVRRGRPWLAPALLLAAFILFPLLPTPQFWVVQANYIGLYALAAIGVVLLTGIGGMTSFGQAAFAGIGAYTSAYLCTAHGVSPWLTLGIGLLLTGASALVLGWVTLRMSGHYLPLATIAWGISLYFLFGKLAWLGNYDGISGVPSLRVFGIDLAQDRAMYYLVWGMVLLAAWLSLNLLDSRPGRALRALKGGAVMAEAMGIDTARHKILLFVLAALLASVSGWLFAHMQRTVNPSPFSIKMGIEYLFMAVVGGVAHIWGALLGAGILKLMEDQLQVWLPRLLGGNGSYEGIVLGLVLILMLKYARHGVWPQVAALAARVLPSWFDKVRQAPAPAEALPRRAMPPAGSPLLQVDTMTKRFGGLVAVNGVSFTVKAGEIVGLIGPNGAGKSTTFNLVSGLLKPTEGTVRFMGEAVAGHGARAIARRGMARTFQHVKLLPAMTVLENVALGAHARLDSVMGVDVARAMLRLDRRTEARLLAEAARALEQVGLAHLMHETAGSLALGQQRILEIARALCCDPVLLLLDEPAAGLRHLEKQALADVLKRLRAGGMSILLVEHDMEFVMQLTDHIVVMEFGTKIAEGTPEQIQVHPAVIEAYLGGIE